MTRYVALYRGSHRNGHVRLVRRTQAHKPHQLPAYDRPLRIGEPPLKPTPWQHVALVVALVALIIAVAWIAERGQP